jgi:AraC-like DNA-binding protein
MAYLRLHRMQSARRALRDGAPDTLRISGVAGRYGFRSASRFAGAYRDLFGELPSWTLRRGLQRKPRIIGTRRLAADRGDLGTD